MFKSESASFDPQGNPPEHDPSVLLGEFAPESGPPEPPPILPVSRPSVSLDEFQPTVSPPSAGADVGGGAGTPLDELDREFETLEAPAVSDTGSSVSLAQLKSHGTRILWFEAVAIVQAVCSAVLESRAGSAELGSEAIFIDSTGRVSVVSTGQKRARATVQSLGEILRDISVDDVPVPLKFVISKSAFSPPLYSSLEEFSQALAYFERPNRGELLQAVYNRWKNLPARPPAVVRVVKIADPEKLPVVSRRPSPYPNVGAAAVLIVVVAMLAGISVLALRPQPQPPTTRQVPMTVETTPPALPRLADIVLTSTPAKKAARPRAPSRRLTPVRGRSAVPAPLATLGPPAAPVPLATVRPPAAPASLATVVTSAVAEPGIPVPIASVGARQPDGVAADAGRQPDDAAITYSASDPDVTPPVAVYPRLPSTPPDARREDLALIEIVVNEYGAVESVKANEFPVNIAEALLVTGNLSAAKTWRFRPASKNSQPVRYRLRVWLQVQRSGL